MRKKKLNQEEWASLIRQMQPNHTIPAWVLVALQSARQGDMGSGPGEEPWVTVKEGTVTKSYLSFLEKQIELEPRGPEWTAVLRKRLCALRPFVRNRYVSVSVIGPAGDCWIKLWDLQSICVGDEDLLVRILSMWLEDLSVLGRPTDCAIPV